MEQELELSAVICFQGKYKRTNHAAVNSHLFKYNLTSNKHF